VRFAAAIAGVALGLLSFCESGEYDMTLLYVVDASAIQTPI